VAQGNSLGISPLDFRQKPALNSVLPLARNHVDFTRYLTTGQVAMQMPFASLELNQSGGGYYGQSKQSGSLVLCDRKQLPSPMGFVCGKPGSGKSFSVKREITNTVLAYPEDQIIIFDPAGEYTNLIDSMGGINIALSTESAARLSPFTITECDGYTRELQIASKTDMMLALAHSIFAEGDRALEGSAESIITRCVGQAYTNTSGAEPTLNDFYEALKRQPELEATTLALHFERYVEGPLKSFCGQGNVAFTERIVNIDLHKLSANMKTFGMIIALEAVFGQIHANFERGVTTWVYIDEVQSFFSHKTIIEYFEKFWAEGRKAGLIATGITQNATYMLAHETARTLVLNSDFILLHKQSALDRKSWVDMLALSATEEGYIDDTAAPGEGLLVAGGVRVPIRDNFPKGALYDLFNTKPTEIAEAKRAARLAG
jgi:type IV secretory pathway VirB4 component